MNISYNWLKDYLDFNLTPEEVGDILTNAGLEVEAIEKFESIKGGLQGLRIGLVKSVEKHTDADKLTVTKVNIGNSSDLQIVCGAPNVAAGQKVIVAEEGTMLYPFHGEPFKIKKAKIRGVASEGMICAADEIGWSEDHSGVMVLTDDAPVGGWAKDFLKVETDYIFQIGLTPNRGDATSHIGVARDLLACLNIAESANRLLKIPSTKEFEVIERSLTIEVVVENVAACPRYSGVSISGITVKESPEWLKNKLKAIGLRPINNIVDIANFVMLECGQPLHAFDADEIIGKKVIVKTLPEGTLFRTLDDKDVKLRNTDLMICNDEEGMCIAGVYGGIRSGVKESTKNIFLESACFNPVFIRRTSTYHNLRTDAASRFEKGTDPNNTLYALKRAALLISEICGGRISSDIIDVYPEPVKEKNISLIWEKLNRISGIEIPRSVAEKILLSLGFKVVSIDDFQINVAAPTFKVDVTRAEDVIEEVLRIYGYDKIAIPDAVRSSLSFSWENKKEMLYEELSQLLASSGFREMMNNSIANSKYHEEFFPDTKDSIARLMSFSNVGLDSLRTSMLFPALEVIRHNHNRRQFDLKLFEFGKTYRKEGKRYVESSYLVLLMSGLLHEESWKEKPKAIDFYFVKALVENVLRKSGIIKFETAASGNPAWQNGFAYSAGKKTLVTFGRVNEKILNAFEIKKEVYYAEFDADVLLTLAKNSVKFSALSRFPAVRRDIAMVIDRKVSFGEIEELAYNATGNLLREVNLFDVYEDEKIGRGKKSYAVSFLFLDETKTLTDDEVDKAVSILIHQFESQLNAHIRS